MTVGQVIRVTEQIEPGQDWQFFYQVDPDQFLPKVQILRNN